MADNDKFFPTHFFVNEDVKPGTLFLIDMNKVNATMMFEGPIDRVVPEPDHLRWATRVHFGFDFGATVEERDPFWDKPPQDFRGGLRWIGRVIGYDWRRLRGKLRRYPRSIGVITGLSA